MKIIQNKEGKWLSVKGNTIQLEEVSIGSSTVEQGFTYEDTGEPVEVDDTAYAVIIPTAYDEEKIYFENENEARKYIEEYYK